MGQLSRKLRGVVGDRIMFWCPGCGDAHVINTSPGRWTFDGNVDRPTFSPSVLATGVQSIQDENGEWTGEFKRDAQGKALVQRCHSWVRDGQIQFLSDSLHALAGKTVELPDLPQGLLDSDEPI